MLKRIFTLGFFVFCLFILSNWLDGCQITRGFKHVFLQNDTQTGLIVNSSQKDSSRVAVLQLQNDSLRSNLTRLESYAKTSDSLLRLQTDTTRRVRMEAEFDRRREAANNKSIQQMFWVLANGQDDIRTVVDSLRGESTLWAQRYIELSEKIADSTKFARATIEKFKDSINLVLPSDTAGVASETKTKVKKPTKNKRLKAVRRKKPKSRKSVQTNGILDWLFK